MRVIILNSTNIIQDGQNNKLLYKFPNSILFKGNSIAVSSVSIYYSWFNINSIYQNNFFYYDWTEGTTTTTYTITIPNGIYEISDLNLLLQYNFIQNGTYLTNSAGQNVYYAEFILNPTRYSVQINTFLFPTALPDSYANPSGLIFPTDSFNPVITIPANFNIIMGFSSNYATPNNINNSYVPPANQTLIAKTDGGIISCLSTQAPNLQPNSSIYVSLSNINNPYSLPSSIIYTIVAQGTAGSLITDKPPQFIWNKLIDGTYSQMLITLLGTDLQPIPINDPQMSIMLTIKDADETGIK
jgi:hypothetical protein